MAKPRPKARQPRRRRQPETVKARKLRANRNRWFDGPEGHGSLPRADSLTEDDLPRLEAAAKRQMARNRARFEG